MGASSGTKPLIILNPAANRGHLNSYRASIQKKMEQGIVEFVETSYKGDVELLAKQAADKGLDIIITGGDGTLNEAINGLLASKNQVALGIIPAGSGNDFSVNGLNLSRDPEIALERALSGTPTSVDVGMVNGRYFIGSFSVGLDADMAASAEKMKQLPFMNGPVLYYSAAIKHLLFGYSRCPWLSIRVNGETVSKDGMQRYVMVAITNGPTYGGGFRISPRAVPDDGFLDMCLVRYVPLVKALGLLPIVQKGQHEGIPEVEFHRIQRVQIESREPVKAQMDGEVIEGSGFEVQIIERALMIRR